MKTDRELLELAAKAAGSLLSPFQCREADSLYLSDSTHWNPLADDGDALRLAVKLDIDIGEAQDDLHNEIGNAAYHTDRYAATRRAIVRASTEIEKEL